MGKFTLLHTPPFLTLTRKVIFYASAAIDIKKAKQRNDNFFITMKLMAYAQNLEKFSKNQKLIIFVMDRIHIGM